MTGLAFWSGRASRHHRGITLLETLVAMMIMTVGLLGMAAIIPLGRLELAEGNISDNAATLGRWAFRDLAVRGYLRPEMWVNPLNGKSVFGGAGSGTGVDPFSLTPTVRTSRTFVPD